MASRKEIEEKKRKAEMEAAHVFEEFIETFQSTSNKPVIQTWIKAGIINADKKEQTEVNTSTLYKPLPRFKSIQDKISVEQAQECARILHVDRKNDKKKSNLESFKEELELIHKDREERQKIKENLNLLEKVDVEMAFHMEQGEPHSTNLYVNNLHPKITEQDLMTLFGKYGPLASIKIMWPRSEEERSRNKNCGFVAYMSRKDAERALKYTNNLVILECELKVGWGKAVLLPSHPIYIPAPLLELSQPPPESGLPFNAQPLNSMASTKQSYEEYLRNSVVKVVIPSDRTLLALINRMVEFVVREGVLFEAMMMTREINNPSFRFLFDNHCSAHIYYRWKLYSVAHGDNVRDWPTKEFRMFKNGSIWKPPIMPNYTRGMPEELIESEEKTLAQLKKTLSTVQRDQLEQTIHKLQPTQIDIAKAMVFCKEHSEAYEEISECIAQSLERTTLPIKKIIARLYLITDILFNTILKPDTYKKEFEFYLPTIMKTMSNVHEQLIKENAGKKDCFYKKITRVLNAWKAKNLFSYNFLLKLLEIFTKTEFDSQENITYETKLENIQTDVSLEKQLAEESQEKELKKSEGAEQKALPGFVPSRWEIVDPDIIESQAMTTSKWSQLQDVDTDNAKENERTTSKCKILSEDKRKKMREIELKVLEFQDELEADNCRNIEEQVDKYRKKLIRQLEEKIEEEKERKRRTDRDYPKRRSKRRN